MKKTIIGLFTALLLVGIAGCKNTVESGGGGGSGGGGSNTSTPYTKVNTQTIGETTYDIVTFGSFPQSEKASTVSITSESKTVGSFTYYKGDDNEWYAELNSKYYKVEPIKWRVLTTDYNGNGKKLLLAENILINKAYHASLNNNYENSSIRAYLTGDFLTTAFTQAEQDAIEATTVINNARSTNPDSNDKEWNNGANQYASDTPTIDKIFLLSEQEATKADYGFAAYNEFKDDGTHDDSTRIRMTTAFAKANGAYQNTKEGYGGYWWLRSPCYDFGYIAIYVHCDGSASGIIGVPNDAFGVVPALCLQ